MIGKPRLSLMAGPIAMVVLVASAGWVLWSSFERSKEASQSVEHTYHVLIASERFLSNMREVESALRAYVITRNQIYVAPYDAGVTAQAQILDDLDRLTKDNPKQQSSLKTIRDLAAQRLALMDKTRQTVTEGRTPGVASGAQPGEGTKIMTALTLQVREFEEEERRLLALRNGAAAEAVSWTRFMLILTSSLLAVVLLFAGGAVQRYVRNREAALEALKRQADLIDFSHDAIVTLNPDGVITGWNAGAVEVYGWSATEALGQRAREILRTNDAEAPARIEDALVQTGRWDGELAQTTKDGRKCVVESRYVQVRSRTGAPVGVLNISRDETQRREAEELLRQVAEQRRLALDAAELGSWDYNVEQDRVIWDERCREILGLPGLGPASFAQALKMVHPEERDTMRGAANRAMSGTGDGRFAYEMRIVLRDGSVRWLATSGRVYFEETSGVRCPVRVIGVNSDITERKRVEEALRESEDKIRVALETGRIGIFNDLPGENKIIFDERAKQILGFQQKEDVRLDEFLRSVHPADREKLNSARNKDIESEEGAEARPQATKELVKTSGGEPDTVPVLREFQQSAKRAEAGRQTAAELGGSSDECPKSAETDPGELDYRIVHPNGDIRWVVARRRVYFTGEGETHRAVRVLGVLLDITQQKRAEQKLTEALRESDQERRRLGAILQTMPAGVLLADRDNKLVEGNAEAFQIWRAGNIATLAERLGDLRGWRADSGQQLSVKDWPRSRALQGETVLGEIIDIERFDGSKGTVFTSASPVRDASGVIQGAVGVMVDITAQRQIELALRCSEETLRKAHRDLELLLEQKNILFQEVQHRVKNNLQIVSSLLSLEAQRFEDSEFHNALNESRDRIRSMALMHEKFYHLDDLARIDFAEYVEELARYFFSSYIADPSAIGFSSNVDVKLRMGDAIPCGLILQELLSNSVKHAFPEGKGEIRIEFHAHDGKCELCYRDSGVGLPARVNLENPGTLGLQLVGDLAKQLRGKIQYQYRQGAQFTLTFG